VLESQVCKWLTISISVANDQIECSNECKPTTKGVVPDVQLPLHVAGRTATRYVAFRLS
jgi:hypothetical protein